MLFFRLILFSLLLALPLRAETPDFSPLEEEHQFDLPDTAESAADYVERVALGESIQSALLTLPFEQRQAILLSDLHGYHYEEIAEMTASNGMW